MKDVVSRACARLAGAARHALRMLLWPTLLAGGLAGTALALDSGSPMLGFNAVYAAVAAAILAAERLLPYEPAWLRPDGEVVNDLSHTLLTKGLAQVGTWIATALAMTGATALRPRLPDAALWPDQWPMAAQVALGLVAAELGLYAIHRVTHEWRPLWRFHALHHSVRRLWVVNTGRFHLVDTLMKVACGQIPLLWLGAPLRVCLWLSAITAFIGLLTHCNIDLRTGPLDRVFNTPGLHRWHHSKALPEGNRNYGENLVLWDQLFGTYYNPSDRRPPVDIGITGRIARGFAGQLAQPFTAAGVREIMTPAGEHRGGASPRP